MKSQTELKVIIRDIFIQINIDFATLVLIDVT